MKVLLLIACIGLVGCAGSAQTRSKVALAISCSTYAQALSQLTPLRKAGRLSAGTVKRVSDTNVALEPICAVGSLYDPAAGVAAVEQAIRLIKTVRE